MSVNLTFILSLTLSLSLSIRFSVHQSVLLSLPFRPSVSVSQSLSLRQCTSVSLHPFIHPSICRSPSVHLSLSLSRQRHQQDSTHDSRQVRLSDLRSRLQCRTSTRRGCTYHSYTQTAHTHTNKHLITTALHNLLNFALMHSASDYILLSISFNQLHAGEKVLFKCRCD